MVETDAGAFAATLRGLDSQARLVVEAEGRTVLLSPAEIIRISKSLRFCEGDKQAEGWRGVGAPRRPNV
jgi:hypothetical protein